MYPYSKLSPGEVVGVQVGLFEHVGIITDQIQNGQLMVISNSRRSGGVAEEPMMVFAAGGKVMRKGYPSQLPWPLVLRRARSLIGKKWKIFWNCEHFIRFAHNLSVESPQLQAAVWSVLAAATVLTISG